jgi:hypothetical protein
MLPGNSPLSSIHTIWHKLQKEFCTSLIFAALISTATGFQQILHNLQVTILIITRFHKIIIVLVYKEREQNSLISVGKQCISDSHERRQLLLHSITHHHFNMTGTGKFMVKCTIMNEHSRPSQCATYIKCLNLTSNKTA